MNGTINTYSTSKKDTLTKDAVKVRALPAGTKIRMVGGIEVDIKSIAELLDARVDNLKECDKINTSKVKQRMNGLIKQISKKDYDNRHGDCRMTSMDDLLRIGMICDMESVLEEGE